MELASSGYLEAVCIFHLLHTETDVCVQLAEETAAQMPGGHILTFLPCEGTVIDKELHGNGRLGDLLEGNGFRVLR